MKVNSPKRNELTTAPKCCAVSSNSAIIVLTALSLFRQGQESQDKMDHMYAALTVQLQRGCFYWILLKNIGYQQLHNKRVWHNLMSLQI